MSRLLRKHIHELFVLKQCKKCQRKQYLEKSSPSLLKCLCEVCLNILNGNIPLTEEEKRKLLKYKNVLRHLVKNHKSLSIKKKAKIIQKGGFLPLVLPPLLAIASGLLQNLLEK